MTDTITLIADLPKCSVCAERSRMLGRELCYPCADLVSLIKAQPEIAKKILATLDEIEPNRHYTMKEDPND